MPDCGVLLQKVSIFRGLPGDYLKDIEKLLVARDFPDGAFILTQKDPGNSLFIIENGKVKVVLFGPSGKEITLSMFKPGDFFGEMSLLDGEPRSANVVAVEDTKLLVLERKPFLEFLHSHPSCSINILTEMSRRLRQADDIIGNLALLDVYGRVARFLRDLSRKDGREVAEGILVKDRPTHQAIASMVGTTRETVSRAFREFERRGFIKCSGRSLLLRHEFVKIED